MYFSIFAVIFLYSFIDGRGWMTLAFSGPGFISLTDPTLPFHFIPILSRFVIMLIFVLSSVALHFR